MAENREFKSSQDLVDVSSLLAEKTKEFEGTDNHLGLTLMTSLNTFHLLALLCLRVI